MINSGKTTPLCIMVNHGFDRTVIGLTHITGAVMRSSNRHSGSFSHSHYYLLNYYCIVVE